MISEQSGKTLQKRGAAALRRITHDRSGFGLPVECPGARYRLVRISRHSHAIGRCHPLTGPLWFELDSGNTQSVLIAPHAAEMRGLDLVKGEPGRASLPVAGLGAVEVDALLKEDLIYDGLLNGAFFRDHVVTIGLRSMRMWIGEP